MRLAEIGSEFGIAANGLIGLVRVDNHFFGQVRLVPEGEDECAIVPLVHIGRALPRLSGEAAEHVAVRRLEKRQRVGYAVAVAMERVGVEAMQAAAIQKLLVANGEAAQAFEPPHFVAVQNGRA